MIRYLKIAFRKPKLIKSFIYKKHLGVILGNNIDGVIKSKSTELSNITIVNSVNESQILNFYSRMDRSAVNSKNIKKWLNNGFECFLIYDKQRIIGGTWIFKKEFELKQLSGRTLSNKKTIKIDDNALYKCYTIIDSEYRGKGLNQMLNNELMNYYSESKYDRIIAITGASNGGFIRATMKCGGFLIGIVQVCNYFGIIRRKEIFIDSREKVWQ